jgi:hypothetical protein
MPAHRLPRRKCFTAVSAGDALPCRIDYGFARRLSLKVALEKRRRPELFPTPDTKFFTDFHLCIGPSGCVSFCVSALPVVYLFVYRPFRLCIFLCIGPSGCVSFVYRPFRLCIGPSGCVSFCVSFVYRVSAFRLCIFLCIGPSGCVSFCVLALPIVYLFVYQPFRLCIGTSDCVSICVSRFCLPVMYLFVYRPFRLCICLCIAPSDCVSLPSQCVQVVYLLID